MESENARDAKANVNPDPADVLASVEKLDVTMIEHEITQLEQRAEKLRRLLAVRRGLKPRSGKRGRRRPAAETTA